MALNDTEEKALKDELAAKQAELERLQETATKTRNELEESNAKLAKEKPAKPKVDPDIAKDIAEAKADIAALKERLGQQKDKPRSKFFLNLFGDD